MYDFSNEQIERYSRHIILKEVGGMGQTKLLESKVLLIGAGGLGSPAGAYLAAAGIGTLGIIDHDVVDLSNLQRQILHGVSDIGRPKTASAKSTIAEINPDVNVIEHRERLSSGNALDILAQYDVVVDGCDNFPTRYLINDACVILGRPNVHGSIYQFEGQVTIFYPGKGPCYRCRHHHPDWRLVVKKQGYSEPCPELLELPKLLKPLKSCLTLVSHLSDAYCFSAR